MRQSSILTLKRYGMFAVVIWWRICLSKYVCMLIPCFQKGCPHLKCQAGEDQVGLKWFPNGSSVEYFPIPIPDPNRPWGADCSTCKGTSAGHFLRPDDHRVHYRNYGREGMMAKPASKVLGDAHKKLLVAKKTLLPTDHVQMWLEHLGEEHKNRVEGAERAAAKKQSMSRKRYWYFWMFVFCTFF